ncbi:YbdK family carboxylate-amine ligase [Herbidospora galbida]|uniref:Putative glutamate--cysteine ligase 2 n=1 Tax=Herbidospora galbida TaxID=2575442 RepID=A0A4U3MCQ8_9ACTN|nr:glutamate--cysteine ligase [Herbidospora galbida]TKK86841.1 YbdK family carboxylate-amine ligase [Herbidospora galbida]
MGRTLGVEEEFLLVDGVTGEPAPEVEKVLADAGPHPGSGGVFSAELFQTQVEAATGICTDLADLRDQLSGARARLSEAARAHGLRLVSVGTPVLPGSTPPVSAGDRYADIVQTHRATISDYQCCGCHVHVGVPDPATGVAVLNHVRPWLPTLVALGANSPYDKGRDSGFASWRIAEQLRFPGAGLPPRFTDVPDYEETVGQLVDCGVLVDTAMTFWLARLGVRTPTIEIRAADAAGHVDDALLQALLTRALVSTSLTELAAGREGPDLPEPVCTAALFNAARNGLSGVGICPIEGREVPATALLDRLLEHVGDALEESGDRGEVRRLLEWIGRTGTGADRQRRAGRRGAKAVVEMLAGQTTPSADT